MIKAQPLTKAAFAAFGDVLEAEGTSDMTINRGLCERYHDRAKLDFEGEGARAGVSMFSSLPRTFPYTLDMVERHPLGSQCFVPMSRHPFLVIVAPDEDGVPGEPLAFVTGSGQAVNFHRGTWHGVLTPLHPPGLFAVIDRIGNGANLQEHWFTTPYIITG